MFYIFHNNVINKNAFERVNDTIQNEWFHTDIWKNRNIEFNIIGINIEFLKYNTFSGNINI